MFSYALINLLIYCCIWKNVNVSYYSPLLTAFEFFATHLFLNFTGQNSNSNYPIKSHKRYCCFDRWRCINLNKSSFECSLAQTIWFFLIYRLFKQEISEFRQVFFGKMAWSHMRSTQILSVSLLCILRFYYRMGYINLISMGHVSSLYLDSNYFKVKNSLIFGWTI